MNRRDFIRLGMSVAACSCGVAYAISPNDVKGCCLSEGQLGLLIPTGETEFLSLSREDPIIPASGDREFDKALGRQLVKMAGAFDVRPGFGYFNDGYNKSAYATSDTRISGTKGTVLFGLSLLRDTLNMGQGGDIAVLGVCAHEFAHIYQFFSGIHSELRSRHHTVKLVELHADYLAGYFIGRLKQERPSVKLYSLGQLINSLGDTSFNHPNHHGTSAERIRATETGFKSASSGISTRVAVSQGYEFVVKSFA